MATAAIKLYFELNGIGGGWTDVTQDTLATSPIVISRGIRSSSPIDRVASTGSMRFTLNNANAIDAGGDRIIGSYSPGHANARGGFREGIGVKLEATFNATTYVLFRGELETVKPEPGRYLSKRVYCTAFDWMSEMSRRKVRALDLASYVRSHVAFQTLIESMPKQPPAARYEVGLDEFPVVFDTAKDEETAVMTEATKIVLSELGACFVAADGTLVFESRRTRGRNSTNVQTFDNTMIGLDVQRARERIVNRVIVVARPRKLGQSDTDVLYNLSAKQLLAPNDARTHFGPYLHPTSRQRCGGTDIQALMPGTDYAFNATADGSGADLTNHLQVVSSFTASGVYLVLTNTGGQTGYVTKLQVRGRPIEFESIAIEATDEESIVQHGSNDLTLTMAYQGDPNVADSAARYFLGLTKDAVTGVERFTFLANDSDDLMRAALIREMSDRIGILEYVTGVTDSASGSATVARGFFINGVDLEIRAGGRMRCSYILTPADQNAYWILGQPGASELGFTTRLAYGLFQGHTDTAHLDVAHSDVAHSDVAHSDVSHSDVAHSDDATHGDIAHGDAVHQDVAHVDVSHLDAPHSDVAHADSSSHSDLAHQDVAHEDASHYDALEPFPYKNTHDDVAHQDVAHQDQNTHSDVAHSDVAHSDRAHSDTAHNDVAHGDTAHVDQSHLDVGHSDVAHADAAHDDVSHSDVAHSDVGHGDAVS